MKVGFTGGALDRADPLRHDPAALAAAVRDPAARVLRLGPGWAPETDGAGRLCCAPVPDGAELALLGLDGGAPRFVALERAGDAVSFRSPAMTAALMSLGEGEGATYAAARSLLQWHDANGFCSRCGHATAPFRAGWGRECPACGTQHFPRTDPVVIMIAEHDGRALLGRQPSWPAGRYSALAGFLEPGESIEEAVVREVREETGVVVSGVRYVASQPWPFPHAQLMIACIAEAAGDAIVLDAHELEDAIWVTRDEVRAALAGLEGRFVAPPPYAIANTLLAFWAGAPGG